MLGWATTASRPETEIWVKLPREADDLLGLPAWFDEAVERILNMGEGTITSTRWTAASSWPLTG